MAVENNNLLSVNLRKTYEGLRTKGVISNYEGRTRTAVFCSASLKNDSLTRFITHNYQHSPETSDEGRLRGQLPAAGEPVVELLSFRSSENCRDLTALTTRTDPGRAARRDRKPSSHLTLRQPTYQPRRPAPHRYGAGRPVVPPKRGRPLATSSQLPPPPPPGAPPATASAPASSAPRRHFRPASRCRWRRSARWGRFAEEGGERFASFRPGRASGGSWRGERPKPLPGPFPPP